MNSFKINFRLNKLDDIVPWGTNQDCLFWFALTDGLLWICAGSDTIYEYSDAAREYFGSDIRFNDYQLSRFLEDFSDIFRYIREPVPRTLYDKAGEFGKLTDAWKRSHIEDPDDIFDKFYDEEYTVLTEWYYNRIFDSGHLIGGPHIGCFRYEDMIKIYWESDYTLENGSSIWTSPKGIYEMPYIDFLSEVNAFFSSFFSEMDKQVKNAVEKSWGAVKLDKKQLLIENSDRKTDFRKKAALLSESYESTDWNSVMAVYKNMKDEIIGEV